jgi:hypothetical protein
MASAVHRLNVTLDPEHAARLAQLAERTHVQEGTLARSLLSMAIEEADPDARNVVALLDGPDAEPSSNRDEPGLDSRCRVRRVGHSQLLSQGCRFDSRRLH